MGTFANDNGTDNQVARSIPSRYANGQWLTSNDEFNWSFGNIRSLNLFFEYVLPNIESGKLGLTDLVRQSIGEAYFFRAYQYYASYSTIGDYPIIDNVLPDDKRNFFGELLPPPAQPGGTTHPRRSRQCSCIPSRVVRQGQTGCQPRLCASAPLARGSLRRHMAEISQRHSSRARRSPDGPATLRSSDRST